MANRQVYYYHIITHQNIEEEIKYLQTYPVVHFKNETCQEKCKRGSDSDEATGTGGGGRQEVNPITTPDESGNSGNDASDIGERGGGQSGLGNDQGEPGNKLCHGTEGIGNFSSSSGKYTVQWRNGRVRKYSTGGGSCERIGEDLGELGTGISGIGAYRPSHEGETASIYNGPYKLVAVHSGTRRRHWHLVYVSKNKQWGFNSRLGRIIRSRPYKCSSINCVACLRKYIYSGNGRQVLQDVLSKEIIEACQCAGHKCGVDSINQWQEAQYEDDCSDIGDTILRIQGTTPENELNGMVDAIGEGNSNNIRKRTWNGSQVHAQDGQILLGRQNNQELSNDSGENSNVYGGNASVILLLCADGAFSEAGAMEVLARTPEGIEFMCSKQYSERIKTYIHIARILVFQESIKQRFLRAKQKWEKKNSHLNTELHMDECERVLGEILKNNRIDKSQFAKVTFYHFTAKSGKRNNLFFLGPPSTGKTMIMNSLVECQFNYCRLTGLTPNSSFNFSGLLHTNACLMDECKLTENQFEQWKLLASRVPMSTDVKYKDRCDVYNCSLYTCSNYPIEMYCKVPQAKQAIDERTLKFEFSYKLAGFINIPPHAWERLWQQCGYEL